MVEPTTPHTPSLAVVIPMYNEGPSARVCAESVLAHLAMLDRRAALVTVDDGSSDDTASALAVARVPPDVGFEVVRHDENRGYGAALRTGTAHAASLRFDWVLFMDSDLTNPPEHIARFAQRITDEIDYLKATRYGPESSVEGVPLLRRATSRAGNSFARVLSGSAYRDPTNGFRAIRTSVFLSLPLTETGFAIIMEEWYWAQEHRLRGADIPTTLRTRSTTQRRSVFGYSPGLLFRYARYPVYAAARRLRLPIRPGRREKGSR